MRHVLVNEDGNEVLPGAPLVGRNEEAYQLVGFRIPRHEASTGRVIVKTAGGRVEREFYPSVFGLKITEIKD